MWIANGVKAFVWEQCDRTALLLRENDNRQILYMYVVTNALKPGWADLQFADTEYTINATEM